MASRRRPQGSPVLDAFGQGVAQALRSSYTHWYARYPSTVRYHKVVMFDGWWDIAASCCQRAGIPEDLLLFVCYAHVNDRPEDAHIHFEPTLFRSQALIERALRNFQQVLEGYRKALQHAAILCDGKPADARGVTGMLSETARHASFYFQRMLEVRDFQIRKASGRGLSDEAWDLLAYTLASQNPFLLANAARTRRMRALAGVNAFLINAACPWHAAAWEGNVRGCSLTDLHGMCGGDPTEFYEDQKLVVSWPTTGNGAFRNSEEWNLHPFFALSVATLCHFTDLYLSAKVELARRNANR